MCESRDFSYLLKVMLLVDTNRCIRFVNLVSVREKNIAKSSRLSDQNQKDRSEKQRSRRKQVITYSFEVFEG